MNSIATAALLGALFALAPAFSVSAGGLIGVVAGDVGLSRPKGCPNRWCACYLNGALKKAGYASSGSDLARNFARYGKPAKPGQVGAIMVMSGHVGVVSGRCSDGRIQVLSGNHSRKVGAGCYSASKAIAWRAPVRPARSAEPDRLKRTVHLQPMASSADHQPPASLASSN